MRVSGSVTSCFLKLLVDSEFMHFIVEIKCLVLIKQYFNSTSNYFDCFKTFIIWPD